jgi:hypothetical protein
MSANKGGRALRVGWIVFACLGTLVLLGSLAWHISSKTETATLSLQPGARASIVVDRVMPDRPRVSLRFAAPTGALASSRPELGEFKTRQTRDALVFANPGARILLRIEDANTAAIYEALPAGSHGADSIGRDLVLFEDDGDRGRFRWPPVLPAESIPAGRSVVHVTVLEVDDAIRGESITVMLEPPLGFKRGTGGMLDVLRWFWLWPVYAVLLALLGLVLVAAQRRSRPAVQLP